MLLFLAQLSMWKGNYTRIVVRCLTKSDCESGATAVFRHASINSIDHFVTVPQALLHIVYGKRQANAVQ